MDINLYNQAINSIFNRFPSFQNVGGGAYKPGLETMEKLCRALGNPHEKFKSVHIAGTNGKGSTSHMIASALSKVAKEDGTTLKVGLYTSPHLVDFRERMKVSGLESADGKTAFGMPPKEYVYSFLVENRGLFEESGASFFEITTLLAFSWFAYENVDIAVVECGLGGRLDATNIIKPQMCVITNIGLDHCEWLGATLESIAAEKAGIIKRGVPVVIGEKSGVERIFSAKAREVGAPVIYAEEYPAELLSEIVASDLDLSGKCQEKNIKTVVAALETLFKNAGMESCGNDLAAKLTCGIVKAAEITGLHGRWETLLEEPFVVCDTGHNAHGFSILGRQIIEEALRPSKYTGKPFGRLVMIFGVVADKDLAAVSEYLPSERDLPFPVQYHFVNAAGTRALPAEKLKKNMLALGFDGEVLANGGVRESLSVYINELKHDDDFVFIGGSTFVVAEALEFFKDKF